jgi:hypothetical protein
VRFEGDNGQLEIHDRELVITREGFRARAAFGKNTPERRVPVDALSGVELKEATRMGAGWLQLSFGGEQPAELSKGTAASNANTITFQHKRQAQFRELRERLLAMIEENSAAGIDAGQVEWDRVSGQVGRFDKRAAAAAGKASQPGEEGSQAAEQAFQERLAKAEADGLRPDIASASARMGTQTGAKREIKNLDQYLHEGEQVALLGAGTYEGKHGIVTLTDQRLLFLFHGRLGQAVEDFPLERIDNVKTKMGLVQGDLTVFSAGKSTVIKSIYKDDLQRLADSLRQRIAGGSQPPQAVTATPVNVADELAKLATLRDQGILTEDEFLTQKGKLLNT